MPKSPDRGSFSRTRRKLLRAGVYAGGTTAAIAVGAGGLWALGINPIDYLPAKPPGASDDQLPQVTRELAKWNNDMRSRPGNFNALTERVVETAVGFYATRMNEVFSRVLVLNPSEIQPQISVDSGYGYTLRQNDVINCTNQQLVPSQEAYVNEVTNTIHFNRDVIAQQSPTRSAEAVFRITLGMLHYITPKPIPSQLPPDLQLRYGPTDTEIPKIDQKGAIIRVDTPALARPGKTCISRLNDQLEYALGAHSTQQMLEGIGVAANYQALPNVDLLRTGILQRWYGNDHKPLLLLQQQSRADQILLDIGKHRRQSLGIPEGEPKFLIVEALTYTNTLFATGRQT